MSTIEEVLGAAIAVSTLLGVTTAHADYDYVNGNQCDTMTTNDAQAHRKAFMSSPADRPHTGIQADNFFNIICSFPGKRIRDSGHSSLTVRVYAFGRGTTTITCGLSVTDHVGRPLQETATAEITFPGDLNTYSDSSATLPSISVTDLPWYANYNLTCETTSDLPSKHRVYGFYWYTSE